MVIAVKPKARKPGEENLPPLVKATDLISHPNRNWRKNPIDYNAGNHGYLTFYKTERMGWCIATLPIANGKRGFADRTYAITLDGEIVRIGQGPHVLFTHTIAILKSRTVALQKYIDLYNKGLGSAGNIRDRISTRRAQGALRRMDAGWW